MSVLSPAAETRTVLENVSWSTYEALLKDLGPHQGRLAYEEGVLEIMSPSSRHEKLKGLLGRLIEAFAAELKIDMSPLGSMTLKRELLRRGVEPDECYYIQNEPLVREKDEIDIAFDPPPDLAIEVEITKSALDRLGIYAALRVPEVWRYDGKSLRIHRLEPDGTYSEARASRVLPRLPVEELERRLARHKEKSAVALAGEFRAWLRRELHP